MNATAAETVSLPGKRAIALAVILLCAAPFAYLCSISLVPQQQVKATVSEIERINPAQPLFEGAGFSANAVFPSTAPPGVNGKVAFYGSWQKSNLSTGTAYSAWFPVKPHFCIFESGYPKQGGNSLYIEARTAYSAITRIPVQVESDPGETWALHCISLQKFKDATQFRLVATDGSQQFWFGVSLPFLLKGADTGELAKQLWLLIATTGAAFFYLLAPGLILRQRFQTISMIWVWVPGVMLLCLIGIFAWKGPAWFSTAATARDCLWLIAIYGAYRLIRTPLTAYTSATERKVLLVVLVLICIAVAKSIYSVDPAGDLYGGTISRTLEVGNRSDSRIPYHVVQLVGLRQSAYGDLGSRLFAPWNFSHRGPIAGLAAAAIVLAGPVTVEPDFPNAPWTIFDPEGFSAYRTAMVAIAACSLLSVFGLALFFLDEQWAFLAFLLAATAPFVVHEIYFTWPKILAAAFVLVSAYLLFRRSYLSAGFWLGIGYLSHPSALFWAPFMVVAAFLVRHEGEGAFIDRRRITELFSIGVRFLMGFIPVALCWALINWKHFAQETFLSYFALANGLPPTVHNWVHSRIDSVLNTLFPLYLFIVNGDDPSMNSIFGKSPTVVEFSLQYWNALPFGAGLAFYCAPFAVLIATAYKRARSWLLLVFTSSVLLFCLYFGFATTGMLREGLHAWVLGLMVFVAIVFERYLKNSKKFWRVFEWCLFARAIDLVVMLLLAAIVSRHRVFGTIFAVSDALAIAVMITGSIWIAWYAFRFCRQLGETAE